MRYMLDGTVPPENTTCEADEPNPCIIIGKQLNLTQTMPVQKRAVDLVL
jgi:hypothetical protein